MDEVILLILIEDTLLRYLYTLLFYLASPVVFIKLLWRSRLAPEYKKRWRERLGFCPFQLEKCIWVHAVSVGETIAASPLVKALKEKYPDMPIVMTHMTPTGGARARAIFGESVPIAHERECCFGQRAHQGIALTARYNTEGPIKQPSPVWKVATNAP